MCLPAEVQASVESVQSMAVTRAAISPIGTGASRPVI